MHKGEDSEVFRVPQCSLPQQCDLFICSPLTAYQNFLICGHKKGLFSTLHVQGQCGLQDVVCIIYMVMMINIEADVDVSNGNIVCLC